MRRPKVDLSITDDELIGAYVNASIAHGAAIDAGDYRTANRQNDVTAAISNELRKRGQERRLLDLLEHENPWVRYWAAGEALQCAPGEAEPVLRRLAALPPSLVRLTAETTLDEWRKGNLKFGVKESSTAPAADNTRRMTETPPLRALIIDRETLRLLPRHVLWSEVTEFERFDHRFGAVNVAEGPIMDVGDEYIELTTDDNKPTHDQLVAWAWLVRPDLGPQLRELASQDMREAIDYYEEEKEAL